MSSKSFQELNLNHGFLFPAALEDAVICRLVLECIIEEPINELSVKVEYTKPYNSEFKCIRLDVYAKDVAEVSYNLEMQNKNEYNLPLRSRYYQAQIDTASLEPGDEYQDLKPLYVIFICNFDPFGKKLYRYTFSMQCEERGIPLNDGVKRIFLSTKGKNTEEVPRILIDFLGYLNDSTDSYVRECSNEKLEKIHKRVTELKKSRDVEAQYMHYLFVDKLIEEKENALREAESALREAESALGEKESALREAESALGEKESALREAESAIKDMIFELIDEFGVIPEMVRKRIEEERDINILKSMQKAAIKANSIEQFKEKIANL